MSDSRLRQALGWLYRFLWLLSVVFGLAFGLYVVYASVLGEPAVGIVGRSGFWIDGWWWAFGLLMIVQSVWYLGRGP